MLQNKDYFTFVDCESVHNHNRLNVGYNLLESAATAIKRTKKFIRNNNKEYEKDSHNY